MRKPLPFCRDVRYLTALYLYNMNTYFPQKLSLLMKLLDGAHEGQVKTMECRQEREDADLRKNQAKQSVETSKNAGKQIKCKEEKERCG